jgi:lipoprotein-anchoring transpeptidase ErfK/SrfK
MVLRRLSVLYLAAASSFTVAIALAQHPTWNRVAHEGVNFTRIQGAAATVAFNDYVLQPGWRFTKDQAVALYHSTFDVNRTPVRMAAQQPPKKIETVAVKHSVHGVAQSKPAAPVAVAKVEPKITAPVVQSTPSDVPSLRPPIVEPTPPAVEQNQTTSDQRVASAPSAPNFTLAPQAAQTVAPPRVQSVAPNAATPDHPPSAAELIQVEQHFRESLTSEMLANFELFLYVSKADTGSVGQRMYVFQKQSGGDLNLLYNWPVSTGREKVEFAPNGMKAPSFTPAGYFELDPQRMYLHHYSGQWDQPMPYAMFFNWENHGLQTGLAIHGASGDDIGLLGTRASAGCVRLAPENARLLFSLIKSDYKGLMPKFAYDKRTATMSNNGVLLHTTDGRVQMAEGYKVLVFIENYGGENVVAVLF